MLGDKDLAGCRCSVSSGVTSPKTGLSMEHSPMPIHPFPYDPFQRRAIEAVDRGSSLFVAAPTGSGKTVLADYVIERTLQQRGRVIYTAPIKALSNQKFRDFTTRYGQPGGIIPPPADRPDGPPTFHQDVGSPSANRQVVGIMTGDVTINPTAPLVIMTTEIYRNTLLEDATRLSAYRWVIFDEVHYLDDRERGTVWEEAILLTPAHIDLLCLSATIPNVQELAAWIRSVHRRPVEVIEETHRPVPLSVLFQCQNRVTDSPQELKRNGYLGQEDWARLRFQHGRRRRFPLHPNRLEPLVRDLLERDRLPCILFTFGRRRTEELAWELSGFPLLSAEERAPLRAMYDELCAKFQLAGDRTADALGRLIDRGVGFHHAGMLPTIKEVVERCFASRRMKVIVTTETFALGINMPARSVVLDALTKRSGGGFELLRRREFLQMAGRAGRRGMDAAGYVYLRINPVHVSLPEVDRLLHGEPEPVRSRFNTAYATLLNLYRRHGRGLLDLFPQTLYYAQTSGAARRTGLEAMQRKLDLLAAMGYITPTELTAKGAFGAWVYGYELLLTELYTDGRLAGPDAVGLAVLMAALVYEPRPASPPPKAHQLSKRLGQLCREPLERIHKQEARFHIHPKTKAPAFHLSQAMEAWMHQQPFERITKLCDADEGEIVRYFRMAVQLLRQLAQAPAVEARLRARAGQALARINRDVIDAEAQLRLG
jgi:superfamily II RNA helicase